jgi:hypothetical protein
LNSEIGEAVHGQTRRLHLYTQHVAECPSRHFSNVVRIQNCNLGRIEVYFHSPSWQCHSELAKCYRELQREPLIRHRSPADHPLEDDA